MKKVDPVHLFDALGNSVLSNGHIRAENERLRAENEELKARLARILTRLKAFRSQKRDMAN